MARCARRIAPDLSLALSSDRARPDCLAFRPTPIQAGGTQPKDAVRDLQGRERKICSPARSGLASPARTGTQEQRPWRPDYRRYVLNACGVCVEQRRNLSPSCIFIIVTFAFVMSDFLHPGSGRIRDLRRPGRCHAGSESRALRAGFGGRIAFRRAGKLPRHSVPAGRDTLP